MTLKVVLGEVVDVASGQVDPREEPYCHLPHVGGDNIESATGRLFGMRTARELALISGKYEFGPLDVLYSKIRPALNKVALPDFAGICSADIYPLRPWGDKLDRRFLAYLLRNDDFMEFADKHSSRTNIPKINRDALLAYEFALPPLPEQRRIADILDKADAIRRKRKEAIALTEELLRSAFLEMFGAALPHVEDGPLPAGWRRMRVDELKAAGEYTCVGGPFGSNLTSKDYVDEGVPVIRGTNLGAKTNTFIDEDFVFVSQAKAADLVQNMAYPGDLVFTQRGTLGQVALIPPSARYQRYVVSQSQMKLTPNAALVTPLFLHSFFCTERMQRYVASHALTTGVPHINLGILRAMPVLVPPKLLQDKFERVAEARKPVLLSQIAARDEAAVLFDSLVYRAFRGELGGTNGASKPQLGLFDAGGR